MSWLSKFGSALKDIVTGAQKVENVAQPVVECLLPASIPIFDVFDHGVEIAKDVEGAFAAAGVAQGGAAKLNAAIPGFSASLDAYTKAKFPGSDSLMTDQSYIASKANLMSAIVQYLNTIPETVTVAPTVHSLISAAAAAAATAAGVAKAQVQTATSGA